MFRHPAVSRSVKLVLLAVTLGFCAYGLFYERAAVVKALHDLAWFPVAGALIAAIAGLGCMMLSWRALLADLGSPLTLPTAVRILFVAQLAKYVPGAVWAAAAQVELAREHRIPRKRTATAAVLSMLISLATGLLVAAVSLPLNSAHAARHYWWALILVLPVLLGLYPPLITFVLNHLLRMVRRPPLERRISMTGMARSFAWSLLGWVFFGLQAWLLVADVTGEGLQVLLLAAGAYALAWSVGFILIPFPGGAGPRELALIAALAPIMPAGPAIAVAVLSRVVMTVGDLAWAALAFVLGWGARRGCGDEGGQAERAAGPARSTLPQESGPQKRTVPGRLAPGESTESLADHEDYPGLAPNHQPGAAGSSQPTSAR